MFFKEKSPRVVFCNNRICIHNNWYKCELKNLALDSKGNCSGFSPIFIEGNDGQTESRLGEIEPKSEISTIENKGGNKIGF